MVNKVFLLGNVGKNPDIKKLDSGTTVGNFPLATNESYTKNGEKVQNTEWHRVVLFGRQAEVAEQYVNQGDLLFVEGKIQTRSFTDNEGNTKYITEIVAFRMQMLGGKQEESQGYKEEPESNDETDDLPF